MNKLMCRFVTTTKEKKKKDPNLDTVCPADIPCKNLRSVQWNKSGTASRVNASIGIFFKLSSAVYFHVCVYRLVLSKTMLYVCTDMKATLKHNETRQYFRHLSHRVFQIISLIYVLLAFK